MNVVRSLVLAAVLVGLASAPVLADSLSGGLDVPGEGISGSLVSPDASEDSAGAADANGQPFRFSEEELQSLGLKPRKAGAAPLADSGPLPPIYIPVTAVVYEEVPYTVRVQVASPQSHRRRSMASRGAKAAPAPAPSYATETRYKTVAVRRKTKMDISPIIMKYAKKHNLDPWLIRAVIEVESAFQPYVSSHAGAGGLMQLMPGTAAGLGCRDRFDPESNIAAGSKYLRQMLDRFGGNHDLAIAAYNAGPGNVSRYGGIPPFAETQRYVVKVRRAWDKGKKTR